MVGTFTIDSADDAIHSNDSIVINGGTFVMATGDDGMHADATLTINGGNIRIPTPTKGSRARSSPSMAATSISCRAMMA